MSHECDLNFVLWKIFFMDFSKPIGVSLWIVYKLPENNCCLRLLTKFIQTILKYSNWKITCHSVLKLSLVTKLLTNLSLLKYIIPSTVALTVSMNDYGGMHFPLFSSQTITQFIWFIELSGLLLIFFGRVGDVKSFRTIFKIKFVKNYISLVIDSWTTAKHNISTTSSFFIERS